MPRAKAASGPAVDRIVDSGRETHARVAGGRKPSMKFPLRGLPNVRYRPGPEWAKALQQRLRRGVRAEQQAFEKSDLKVVTDRSLPEKLKHPETFLP